MFAQMMGEVENLRQENELLQIQVMTSRSEASQVLKQKQELEIEREGLESQIMTRNEVKINHSKC